MQIPPEQRRNSLRRLDDLLEALEQLNLHEVKVLPPLVARRLVEAGIADPFDKSISSLIEQVWALQQPYLINLGIDRRRRRRRQQPAELWQAG